MRLSGSQPCFTISNTKAGHYFYGCEFIQRGLNSEIDLQLRKQSRLWIFNAKDQRRASEAAFFLFGFGSLCLYATAHFLCASASTFASFDFHIRLSAPFRGGPGEFGLVIWLKRGERGRMRLNVNAYLGGKRVEPARTRTLSKAADSKDRNKICGLNGRFWLHPSKWA